MEIIKLKPLFKSNPTSFGQRTRQKIFLCLCGFGITPVFILLSLYYFSPHTKNNILILGSIGWVIIVFYFSYYFSNLMMKPIQLVLEQAQSLVREQNFYEYNNKNDNNNKPIKNPEIRLMEGQDELIVRHVFDDLRKELHEKRQVAQTFYRQEAWVGVAQEIAHELKNPLTPIQLSAERISHKLTPYLQKHEYDELIVWLHKATNTIVTQVQSMSALINHFRAYAQMPVANKEILNVAHLLENIKPFYEKEAIQWFHNVPPSVYLYADKQHLRQIIINLIQNALDAIKPLKHHGHVTIRLFVRHANAAKYLVLKVTDNGSGFNDDILQTGCQPYKTTKAHGTGLGLAIVKNLIEQQGGMLSLTNINRMKYHKNSTLGTLETLGAKVEVLFPID